MPPSSVIDVVETAWLTVSFITVSTSTLLTPSIISPLTKVPVVVSSLISISVTTIEPSWNLVIFSTMAVASLISESAGLLFCFISWPIKNIGLLTACVAVWVQRIKVLLENWPPDTRSISSAGLYTSDGSLNNILKNVWWALSVPFARYNDLIFLINFLLSKLVSVSVGIVLRNSSFICVKKSDIVWSGSE